LLDLKYLLIEARQFVPPFLKTLNDPSLVQGECSFCGGLGHRAITCAKLEAQRLKATAPGGSGPTVGPRFGGGAALGGGDL
jgi:ATP-dependent RNA helicase DDX41